MGKSDVVSGISLIDHYRDDVLAHKEFRLISPFNANRHQWVATEVIGIPSILNIVEDTLGYHSWQSLGLVGSPDRHGRRDM